MKYLKIFEGFNDNNEFIKFPLDVTVAQVKSILLNKNPNLTVEEMEMMLNDFINHLTEVHSIDVLDELDSFLNDLTDDNTNYINLKKLIETVWDGDVSFKQAVEGFSVKELDGMEILIKNNKNIFNDGVPFTGDDERFDNLLKTSPYADLILKMIDNIEG